jgi:hypothetical protein
MQRLCSWGVTCGGGAVALQVVTPACLLFGIQFWALVHLPSWWLTSVCTAARSLLTHLFLGLLVLLVLQVSPRPLITPVPLGVPGAPADAAPPGSLEEEGMRLGLAAAAVKAAADAADGEG